LISWFGEGEERHQQEEVDREYFYKLAYGEKQESGGFTKKPKLQNIPKVEPRVKASDKFL
jgi:hypothetical protein